MNQKGLEPMRARLSVQLDEELLNWVEKESKAKRRSLAEIIRMAIEYAKENWSE